MTRELFRQEAFDCKMPGAEVKGVNDAERNLIAIEKSRRDSKICLARVFFYIESVSYICLINNSPPCQIFLTF